MADRPQVALSTAKSLIAEGKATAEEITDKFDVVADQPQAPAEAGPPRPAAQPDKPLTVLDVAGSIGKGVLRSVGVPTSMDELTQSAKDAALMVVFPPAALAKQAVELPGQLIGAAKAISGPARAYASGRAPTRQENVSAIETGSTVAAMGATAALAPRVIPKLSELFKGKPLEIPLAKPELQPAQPTPVETQAAVDTSPRTLPPIEQIGTKTGLKPRALASSEIGGNPTTEQHLTAARLMEQDHSLPLEEALKQAGYGAAPVAPIPTAKPPKSTFAPLKEFMDAVAPAAASEDAGTAAGIVRNAKADISNAATLERYKNRANARFFESKSDVENVSNISNYEKTGSFKDSPTGYSEFFKKSMELAHETLQQAYGENRVGYVENYVRRAFKFGTEVDASRATAVLTNEVGSLSANTSPLKGRVLDMPLDEALARMREAGIAVEPITTNPELLRQWSVENAKQAIAYKTAWAEAKNAGLIEFAKTGQRAPAGLVPLEDRVAQVFFPSDAGLVKAGQYYADPNVARIFNNTISKGLGGSPTYRGLRAINNTYNQLQLGMSGFHLTGTAINAGISDLALGIEQLAAGDVVRGANSVVRSVVPGYSFVRDIFKGRQFVNDLMAGDPEAAKILNEKMNPAGARLGIDQAYRNMASENMMRAWRNNQPFRAAANVPLAIVQKVASPLMEYAIPRVKIAAFLDLAEAKLRKLGPETQPNTRQRALESAWDSIDNRFGLIVHDNLFWNKTARDLAQISTRSVGWNLGTLRELGGGLVDVPRAMAGKGVSSRLLYTAALPIYAGTIGAIYQFLHTGKRPQGPSDYFYPKNGLNDRSGNPDRVALPTYMKDVYAYSTSPVATVEHKASPLLSMTTDLMTNRDYSGDMIRNPEDPVSKQFQQLGSYALRNILPFSVQQATQMHEEGSSAAQMSEQFLGFTRAPGSIRKTPEQLQFESDRARLRPHTPLTPEQKNKPPSRLPLELLRARAQHEQAIIKAKAAARAAASR